MTATMKAVVLDEPGPVTNLHLRYLPVPEPAHGWVRIKVEAFGLSRSELHTRLGLAEGVTFPRVPGIEATGRVDADPDGLLQAGQQVAAMMGQGSGIGLPKVSRVMNTSSRAGWLYVPPDRADHGVAAVEQLGCQLTAEAAADARDEPGTSGHGAVLSARSAGATSSSARSALRLRG
jgi:NADPH:quinone reductase-like Zn-dependent oxidoreductase